MIGAPIALFPCPCPDRVTGRVNPSVVPHVATFKLPGKDRFHHLEVTLIQESARVLRVDPEEDRFSQEEEHVGQKPVRGTPEVRLIQEKPAVEHNLASRGRDLAQGPKCILHRFAGQIHRHAFPDEKDPFFSLEARLLQPFFQGFRLEIDEELFGPGRGESALSLQLVQDARFSLSRGRVIHFQERSTVDGLGVAVSPHVVTCSKDDDPVGRFLFTGQGFQKPVIHVPMTGQDEGGEAHGEPSQKVAEFASVLPGRQRRLGCLCQKTVGEGVVQDPLRRWPFLFRGPLKCGDLSGFARSGIFHLVEPSFVGVPEISWSGITFGVR